MPALDLGRTALVLIDLQEWTLAMPLAPRPAAEVLRNANALADAVRKAGGTVVLTRVAFSAGYADALRQPVDLPLVLPEGGLPDAALALSSGFARSPSDLGLVKRQWSAFYGTELDLQLRRRAVCSVVLGGVMTNFGVESTARDAWQHAYEVIVAEDACSSLGADLHRFSIGSILPRVARVRPTEAIVQGLSGAGEG